MTDYINEVFGPQGYLAQKFAGYEPRPAQIEIVRAIDDAIRNEKNLLVEAPCGSGKGLSYLTPSIRHSLESGASRVLVVTANIALTEQLIKKDLPTLHEVLPWSFEFAMAKGRSNFVCLHMHDRIDRPLLRVLQQNREQLEYIDGWLKETNTGDLSELPFEPTKAIKQRLTVTSDDCIGKDCPRKADCFVDRAIERLDTAKVVVTNYHLFFADRLVRRMSDGLSGVLPNADIVVFDECDKSGAISRNFYGFDISRGQVEYAAKFLTGDRHAKLPELDQDLKIKIQELTKTFFDALATYAKSKAYKARLREPDAVSWVELNEAIKEAAQKYAAASGRLDIEKPERERLKRLSFKCYKLASNIRSAMQVGISTDDDNGEDDNYAYFIRVDDKGQSTLCGSPIEVAEQLKRDVWENTEYRSVIGTSATLTTDGDFDWIKEELGAEDAEELIVDSPFNIRDNMLIVVPEGLPLPNDREFQDVVGKVLCKAIEQARGRTLGLFTSYKGLRSAEFHTKRAKSKQYQQYGEARNYRILVQGEAPRTQLVEQFRQDVPSVLLGTESFWTGVDVQGEALACLFIDKLPFPSPDDPILDALSEKDPKGHWMKNCLPRALIAFRQGIGRLLRTTTDRGVVVICDSRIVDKPYGRTFLKACSGAKVSRSLTDIGLFLDNPDEWKRKHGKQKAKKVETARTARGARAFR